MHNYTIKGYRMLPKDFQCDHTFSPILKWTPEGTRHADIEWCTECGALKDLSGIHALSRGQQPMTLMDFLHQPKKTWHMLCQFLRTLHCRASHQHQELRAYTPERGRHVHCQACGYTSHGDAYCTLVKGSRVKP